MRRALRLAKRGAGRVHPNPLVGAVLVKNGRVIAGGAHLEFGGPHAEVRAILRAGGRAAGGVLYVTLEPCAHTGKTPPCVDLILKSRLRKVVAGMTDPNPLVSGKGFAALKKAGVEVVSGVLNEECAALNKDFAFWVRRRLPYVVVKTAQSLDGKIATATGRSRWITGEPAREWGHRLRAEADGVLVGVRTILNDDPLLSARTGSQGRAAGTQPLKIVLDSKLRTPRNARIFSRESPGKVLILTARKPSDVSRARYGKRAEIAHVASKNGKVDFKSALCYLGRRGIVRLLVEGGGETLASAFLSGLVQEAYFFIAPKIIGGRHSVSSVGGPDPVSLDRAVCFRSWEICPVGGDLLVHGVL